MRIKGAKTCSGSVYTVRCRRVPQRAMAAYRLRREKTLYLTDLDGTLLRSDETISARTAMLINRMVAEGMHFTYATARSRNTARKVTAGLDARMPVIVYNGAFVLDNTDASVLVGNYFAKDEADEILGSILRAGVSPIVYARHEGKEQFRYNVRTAGESAMGYVATRAGDPRDTPVECDEALYMDDVFYFTCIAEERLMRPLYERYRDRYHCVYYKEIYTGVYWLEIMPSAATKAHAGQQLKDWYGASRVVAFGDSTNDSELFDLADESYAVANATPQLRSRATAVIGDNNSDSVARWLCRRWDRII